MNIYTVSSILFLTGYEFESAVNLTRHMGEGDQLTGSLSSSYFMFPLYSLLNIYIPAQKCVVLKAGSDRSL